MIWTTDKPTQTAFYWYWADKSVPPIVVYVDITDEGFEARFTGFEDERSGDSLPGRWSGPLTPPIDYQAQAVSDELPYAN